MRREICAVVPAAGRGSRLGIDRPKILAEIGPHCTVWTILRDAISPLVDQIHVVVAPAFRDRFAMAALAAPHPTPVSIGVQDQPRGMGDAILGARGTWSRFEHVLIVWGDQAGVSRDTLSRAIAVHRRGSGPRCSLPIVQVANPYVQYCFVDGRLEDIRQAREGASVDSRGSSDAGVFLLTTAGLSDAWERYSTVAAPGSITGEANFLPFLTYLSRQCGWRFETVPVADPSEARGLNTVHDLEFFRQRLAASLLCEPAISE